MRDNPTGQYMEICTYPQAVAAVSSSDDAGKRVDRRDGNGAELRAANDQEWSSQLARGPCLPAWRRLVPALNPD